MKMKCMGRKVIAKDPSKSETLGEWFLSVRPSNKRNADGDPEHLVISLHGAETLNGQTAYHFALFPDVATAFAERMLDITIGPEEA